MALILVGMCDVQIHGYFYVKLEKMAKGGACVTIVFNYIHTKSNDQCLAAKSLNYSTIIGKWYAG